MLSEILVLWSNFDRFLVSKFFNGMLFHVVKASQNFCHHFHKCTKSDFSLTPTLSSQKVLLKMATSYDFDKILYLSYFEKVLMGLWVPPLPPFHCPSFTYILYTCKNEERSPIWLFNCKLVKKIYTLSLITLLL